MLKLEDIRKDAAVTGIEPDQVVRVVTTEPVGPNALNVYYTTADGRVLERMLFRADEANLVLAEAGRPWAFDAPSAWAMSGYCSSQSRLPQKAACAPKQITPVRCSCNPSSTVSRPQPNKRSAWRALPPQYFSAMAAWNDRRSTPVIFELANRKSSIWEADKDRAVDSVAEDMVILPGQCGNQILPDRGDYFP